MPPDVAEAVAPVLGGPPADVRRVGGGCISPAARVAGAAGTVAFLKWSDGDAPAGLFAAEAECLAALDAPEAVRVPEVLGVDGDRWLLLEWLEPAAVVDGAAWGAFGRGLAELHRADADGWGWERDNFIGPLPQANGGTADWATFWGERRLRPQLERGLEGGYLTRPDGARLEGLVDALAEIVGEAADADGPSLVHGDLWSGNAHGTAGAVALVDPAAYRGHREVDLAMVRLFGGFPAEFFEGYDGAWPLAPGWRRRVPVYQLYYLLVHVNLFGAGYLGRTRVALEEAGF